MVLKESQKLNGSIRSLLRLSTYDEYDDLSGLHIDYEDGQQLFLQTELREIMEKLSDVERRISYLSRPVKETSRLHKNGSGRYETKSGHCGGRSGHNPGAGAVPVDKRVGAAYPHDCKGKTADQHTPFHSRDIDNNGGYADKLCKGYCGTSAHEL